MMTTGGGCPYCGCISYIKNYEFAICIIYLNLIDELFLFHLIERYNKKSTIKLEHKTI